MPLQSWASDNEALTKQIQRGYPDYLIPQKLKVLGVGWDISSVIITVRSGPVNSCTITKRKLFSHISKVFDPFGLFSPVTIKGLMLVQKAWKTKNSFKQENSMEEGS